MVRKIGERPERIVPGYNAHTCQLLAPPDLKTMSSLSNCIWSSPVFETGILFRVWGNHGFLLTPHEIFVEKRGRIGCAKTLAPPMPIVES